MSAEIKLAPKMTKIHRLRVTLDPSPFVAEGYYQIHVTVEGNGLAIHFEEYLPESHFDALLDVLMDKAKYLLRQAIKGEDNE